MILSGRKLDHIFLRIIRNGMPPIKQSIRAAQILECILNSFLRGLPILGITSYGSKAVQGAKKILLRGKIGKDPPVAIGRYPLHRLVSMNIKTVHKQWCMLRPIGIPSVLQHIVRKLPHSVEIFAILVCP